MCNFEKYSLRNRRDMICIAKTKLTSENVCFISFALYIDEETFSNWNDTK